MKYAILILVLICGTAFAVFPQIATAQEPCPECGPKSTYLPTPYPAPGTPAPYPAPVVPTPVVTPGPDWIMHIEGAQSAHHSRNVPELFLFFWKLLPPIPHLSH